MSKATERTYTSPILIYDLLRSQSRVSKKGAILILSHASVESYNRDKEELSSMGFNYWNFGKPAWWNKASQKIGSLNIITVLNERPLDDVGATLGFANPMQAIFAYLEMMKKGRGTAFNEVFKDEPDIEKFIDSLCAAESGLGSTNYATACKTHYPSNIRNWYDFWTREIH